MSAETSQKRVAEQRQRLGDAAGGLERAAVVAAFERVADRQAEARAVAERLDDLLLEPGGVDDDLAHAVARQRLEVPLDQRLAVHLEQRLGRACRSAAACARRGRRPGPIAFIAALVRRPRRAPRSTAWRSTRCRRERRRPGAASSVSARAELSAPRLQT